MVYMWAYFLINYKSLLAATIAVVLISFSLVLGVAAVILNRAMRQNQPWLAAGAFAPDLERNYSNYSASSRQNNNRVLDDEEIGLDLDHTPQSTRSSRGVRVGSSSRGVGESSSRWR